MGEAWERQKWESASSYNRFKIYLDLPPEQRTLMKVHEKLEKICKNSKENDKIPTLSAIESNSVNWKWSERARLYDAHEQLKESLKYEKEFTKENKKIINLIKTD